MAWTDDFNIGITGDDLMSPGWPGGGTPTPGTQSWRWQDSLPDLAGLAVAGLSPFLEPGQTQQQNQWGLIDPAAYAFTFGEREQGRNAYLDMIGGILGRYSPEELMSGAGVNIRGGHASADLIDMSDPAFALEAPLDWRTDIYNMARSASDTAFDTARNRMLSSQRAYGRSVNDPRTQSILGEMELAFGQEPVRGLTEASTRWTEQARGLRAGALGTNASLGTQVSIANAQMSQAASEARARLGLARYSQMMSALQWMLSPTHNLQVVGGGSTSQYNPGSADYAAGIGGALARFLEQMQRNQQPSYA